MKPDLITQDLFGNEIRFYPGNEPRNKDTTEIINGFSSGEYTPFLVLQKSEPKYVIKMNWLGAYAHNYEPELNIHDNPAAVVVFLAKPKEQANTEKFIEFAHKMGIVELTGVIL